MPEKLKAFTSLLIKYYMVTFIEYCEDTEKNRNMRFSANDSALIFLYFSLKCLDKINP